MLHTLLGPPDRRVWSALRQLRVPALLQATQPERAARSAQSAQARAPLVVADPGQLQPSSFSDSELRQHVESFCKSKPLHGARVEYDQDRAQVGRGAGRPPLCLILIYLFPNPFPLCVWPPFFYFSGRAFSYSSLWGAGGRCHRSYGHLLVPDSRPRRSASAAHENTRAEESTCLGRPLFCESRPF